MKILKKSICIVAATAMAFSMSACTTQSITVSFDQERPWHDGASSYEQLNYTVAVYDTTNGTADDKRVLIADGTTSYTLEENTRQNGSTWYSTLNTDFTLTYNDKASETDKGKTDTVTSSVEFNNDSLSASKMQKTVTLAERTGVENLSYSLTSDYFNATASQTFKGKDSSLSLNHGTHYDNEMIFHLARATALDKGSGTYFYLTNVFDSFLNGSSTTYTMYVSCNEAFSDIAVGDWIQPLVVEEEEENTDDETQTQDETDEQTPYTVPCYKASVSINAEKSGQPYVVYYSSKAIKSNDKTHKKVPLKITYAEYSGTTQTRITEYTLSSVVFEKQ